MFQRIVDLLLLCGLISGAGYFWQSASMRNQLANEHARLLRKVGKLDILSRDKIYLQALDTGEPLHFAWRMFLPKSHTFAIHSKTNVLASGSGGEQECTLRYRFYERHGKWYIYKEFFYFIHGHTYELKSPELLEILVAGPERIRQLQIEQLATRGTVEVGLDQTVTLLKISRPVGEPLPPGAAEPYVEWLRLGPKSLFDNPTPWLPAE